MSEIYVVDTNVILEDFEFYKRYQGTIIIPFKVLEEIETFKKRRDAVGYNARKFVKFLEELRVVGDLQEGVPLEDLDVKIQIKRLNPSECPYDLDIELPDNKIITTAKNEIRRDNFVTVLSNDVLMRIKCDSLDIRSQEHESNSKKGATNEIFTGYKSLVMSDTEIDAIHRGEDVRLSLEDESNLSPNEFLLITSAYNQKKSLLAKFVSAGRPIKKVRNSFPELEQFDFFPRNVEQVFALNLLLDPSIKVVTMVGSAGTGKTLLALVSGLVQIDVDGILKDGGMKPMKRGRKKKADSATERSSDFRYSKLIITRPIQPMGKDIGFLPGSIEEKFSPWTQPIVDNLDFLLGNSQTEAASYLEAGIIQIEVPTFIRGRTIPNCFMIVDEIQNITKHELKTIMTRVGENTKIILTGDIEQIDNEDVDDASNGLSYAIDKFKKYELSGHITLVKGERSEVATLSAKIL